jgi:hypothetical protein
MQLLKLLLKQDGGVHFFFLLGACCEVLRSKMQIFLYENGEHPREVAEPLLWFAQAWDSTPGCRLPL